MHFQTFLVKVIQTILETVNFNTLSILLRKKPQLQHTSICRSQLLNNLLHILEKTVQRQL